MQKRTILLISAGIAALLALLLRAQLAAPTSIPSTVEESTQLIPTSAESPPKEVFLEGPAPLAADAPESRHESLAGAISETARITGACTPPSIRRVKYVHESGDEGAVKVQGGRYEIEVSRPGRYWLSSWTKGYRSARVSLEVELEKVYTRDFELDKIRSVDIVVSGVDVNTFQWPATHRVVAVRDEIQIGTSLPGLRGGNQNPYGFSRLRLLDKPLPHPSGAKIGHLEVDAEAPCTMAVCAESRVVWVAPLPPLGTEFAAINWDSTRLQVPSLQLRVEWSGDAAGIRTTLFTESGGVLRGAKRGSGADFRGLAPGTYLLQAYGGTVGIFLREVVLKEEDLEVQLPSTPPVKCALVFIDAESGDRMAFDLESQGEDWDHFVELIPVDNGQPVAGYMDTGAMRHSGPGIDGTATFELAHGLYRARLRSPEWGSSFVLIDARESDIEVTIPCSKWSHVTIHPGAGRDWRGRRLTLSGADGNLLSQRLLDGSGPIRVKALPGWTQAQISSLRGSVLAKRSFDSSSGVVAIELN